MYLTAFTCSILLIQVGVTLCNTTVTDIASAVTTVETASNNQTTNMEMMTANMMTTSANMEMITTSANPNITTESSLTTKMTVTKIGGKCDDNSSCAIPNTICQNNACKCRPAFFKFSDTVCRNVSRPEAPINKTVLVLNETTLVLEVKKPAQINGRMLEYKTTVYLRQYEDQDFSKSSTITQASTTSNYTNITIPLTPGVFFKVSIFSKNERFTSMKSVNYSGQAKEIAPEGVLINNMTTTTNISARIQFTRPKYPNGAILGYTYSLHSSDGMIKRSGTCSLSGNNNPCNGSSVTLQRINRENLAFTFESLLPYTNYSLQITAFNKAGKGTDISTNFMTRVGFPLKPSITDVNSISSTSAVVHWSVSMTRGPTRFKACIYSDTTKCCDVTADVQKRNCTISILRPFTDFQVVVTATTLAGSIQSNLSSTFKTLPGAPHDFKEFKLGKITSTSAELIWLYENETGNTTFNINVIDTIDRKTLSQARCQNVPYSRKIQKCIYTKLDEFWKYKFEIIIKVADVQETFAKTISFITNTSEPGSPQNLGYTSIGSECDSSQYYLYWEEPGRKDRNGCIAKYVIQYMENTVSKKGRPCPSYNHKNNSYTMALATIPGQTFYLSIHAVLKDRKRSAIEKIKIERPSCGLSPLSIALIVISLLVGILSGIFCFIAASYWKGRVSSVPIQTLGTSLIRTFSRKRLRRNRPVAIDSLPLIVDKMTKNSNYGFALEFQDLNDLSIRRPALVALSEENKVYNRYNDIYPFDESRVKLSSHHTDYINASYIPGYVYEREYIAAQGPLQSTVNDFWKMIWEQDVSVIVMLTRCQEGHVIKCEQYWPLETDQPTFHGEIEVTRVSILKNTEQETVSELRLKMGTLEKKVMHFHFLIWRDHSASMDPGILINFIGEVRKHFNVEAGPMTIHCSAGVGRSGTFIAVDYFLQYVREHDLNAEVDIFEYVLKMRDHRVKMVQNEEQYRFVYEAVKEMVKRKRDRLKSLSDSVINMSSSESDEEEELEEEEEEEEEVNEEDNLKAHETESEENDDSEEEEDEEGGANSPENAENKESNSVELLDENQIDDVPIILNEHQTTEL